LDLIWAFELLHKQDGTEMKKHPNQIMLEKIRKYNEKKEERNIKKEYDELMQKVLEKTKERLSK
jgi:hypothetical protein